ncbi:MAG: hypothetical protein GY839_11840 [candidate division Zixibacteria bacterium]|nr:hypothetical protein [candidate division Zixibacteria bacterium]
MEQIDLKYSHIYAGRRTISGVREPAHSGLVTCPPPSGPEVMEPAHFRKIDPGILTEQLPNVLKDIAALLRKYGY